MELNNKEVALKKEKSEQEGLKNQLEKLESQLLSGTGSVAVQSILNNEANMVDHTNEQQKILEIRKKEVAERRRAQHAAAQELEQIEDLGKEMEKTYGTLQNEVETKTRKLRKLFTKLQTFKQEIVDVTEEYNRDRRDLEETQQQLLKELKLKMLIRYYIHTSKIRQIENLKKKIFFVKLRIILLFLVTTLFLQRTSKKSFPEPYLTRIKMFGFFKLIPKLLDLLLVNVQSQQQDLEDLCQNMLVCNPGYVPDSQLESPVQVPVQRLH